MNFDWELAGAVILSGLAIVFMILILLIWMVMITGKIVNSASKTTATPAAAPKPAAPAVKPAVSAAPTAPVVQSGIEEETVAAISAAVYSTLNTASSSGDVSYVIKSISRATGGRPVWGFAGMQHNTRPF